jgi:hypothetical protein
MSQLKKEEISASKQKRGNLTSGLTLARKLRPNKNKLAPQKQSSLEQEQSDSMTDSFYYNQRNLQLIASKCRCEFYMIDFDDKLPNSDEKETDLNNINTLNQHQSLSSNVINGSFSEEKKQNFIDLNGSFNEPIDCFTLIHHDLNLCTNSKQYKMIMDLVNNLVLYFRPRRKQVIDKQKSIKFNLQLSMGIFLFSIGLVDRPGFKKTRFMGVKNA